MRNPRVLSLLLLGILSAPLLAAGARKAAGEEAGGRWTAGDLHTHTVLSDGRRTLEEVARHAFANGLDWFITTDHGGSLRKGSPLPAVEQVRKGFPGKEILVGFEWSVPGHEHAVVAIADGEPRALEDFEYICDARSADTGRDLPKWNRTRADALSCAAILEGGFGRQALFLPNHPSRAGGYSIADLRELNDTAPTAMFGFEGIPGHQKGTVRGAYGLPPPTGSAGSPNRTYGGADSAAAAVGGVWDALLGEGRRFFLFANSDFHDDIDGFWPGEYAKTYVFVKGNGPLAIVRGLRSGNSFSVTGNLIDALSFRASAGGKSAVMGETLRPDRGDRLEILIEFRSPDRTGAGGAPGVDHIDVISGRITGKKAPGARGYRSGVHPSTRVARRLGSGDWSCDNGICRARVDAGPVAHSMYIRLRGTNLPPSTPRETDGRGNPLSDDEACEGGQAPPKCNTGKKALADLWFYSNPIFLEIPPDRL